MSVRKQTGPQRVHSTIHMLCQCVPIFWIRTEIRTLSSIQVLTLSKPLNKATKQKTETHSSVFQDNTATLKSLFAVWRIFVYSTFYGLYRISQILLTRSFLRRHCPPLMTGKANPTNTVNPLLRLSITHGLRTSTPTNDLRVLYCCQS